MIENFSRFKIIKRHKISRKMPGTLRLCSLQPLKECQELQHLEQLWVKPECADRDFQSAYLWMMHQMTNRLADYHGHYPWWAYLPEKPDLRCWKAISPVIRAYASNCSEHRKDYSSAIMKHGIGF